MMVEDNPSRGMARLALTLLAICFFGAPLACDPPPPVVQPKVSPRPKPPPAPKGPYSVILDGEPLPIETAVATALGQHALRISLSIGALSCGAESSDREVSLQLVRELGGAHWRVVRVEVSTRKVRGEATFAMSNAPTAELPSADTAAKVTVQATLNVPIAVKNGNVRLEIDGTIEAKGCGAPPAPADASERQDELTMKIGAEELPIMGATYLRDPEAKVHRVTLSTSALECGEPGAPDVLLELVLDNIGRSVQSATLSGLRAGDLDPVDLDKGALHAKLRGGGKVVHVDLAGQATLHQLYAVELKGTAHATLCE